MYEEMKLSQRRRSIGRLHNKSGCYSPDSHQRVQLDIVKCLRKRGYEVYTEHKIKLWGRRYLQVDVFAFKEGKIEIYEVGHLADRDGGRLNILRNLFPSAKIFWIRQFKHYDDGWSWYTYYSISDIEHMLK